MRKSGCPPSSTITDQLLKTWKSLNPRRTVHENRIRALPTHDDAHAPLTIPAVAMGQWPETGGMVGMEARALPGRGIGAFGNETSFVRYALRPRVAILEACDPETEAATGTMAAIAADPVRRHADAGVPPHAATIQKTIWTYDADYHTKYQTFRYLSLAKLYLGKAATPSRHMTDLLTWLVLTFRDMSRTRSDSKVFDVMSWC